MRFIAVVAAAVAVSCNSNKTNSIIMQAQVEAERIVSEANAKADLIVSEANAKADQIVRNAEKEAQQTILRNTNGSYANKGNVSETTVSLNDILKILGEYEGNSVAAENKYKGRVFVTSINDFDIDAGAQINIKKHLGIKTIWFAMDQGQKDVIASLNKKQTIKIVGTVSSWYGSLWFENCRILEIYD